MEIRHGGLALDVPADWRDQSTLLFVAPIEDGERASEVVSVSFHAGAIAPRDLLRDQADQMRAMDPALEVIGDGPFDCALGEGWSLVQKLTLDGNPVQQIVVACPAGGTTVMATAATSPDRFADRLEQLKSILNSLRPA